MLLKMPGYFQKLTPNDTTITSIRDLNPMPMLERAANFSRRVGRRMFGDKPINSISQSETQKSLNDYYNRLKDNYEESLTHPDIPPDEKNTILSNIVSLNAKIAALPGNTSQGIIKNPETYALGGRRRTRRRRTRRRRSKK